MLRILALSLFIILPTLVQAESTGLPNPEVVIKTNYGEISLRLFRDKAPITVENFLNYVDSGHYNGTIFHRIIPQFMVQGGGFLPDMTKKETGEAIVNESKNKLHNTRGTIAMARTNHPDSATNQFFINQSTNLGLDWVPGKPGYTVFGEVTSGLDVVDFIVSSPARNMGGFENVPIEAIIISEIKRKSLL
ncbi:MAG: cyclophilin family peptidyl-prolyl cis-trans isomerase [Halioglobus sp.]|jgi:cyclophilin family peptidyl-prolyl cis-trans isomerase